MVLVRKPAVQQSREGSSREWGRAWLRKTSPGDGGCFISLLRVNLTFTIFKQTQVLRDFGELTAKDVSNEPISRMIFAKLCVRGQMDALYSASIREWFPNICPQNLPTD